MQKIGVIVNKKKDKELAYTREVCKFFHEKGIDVFIHDPPQILKPDKNFMFIVVLGGDGTMLKACTIAAICDVPLIGINLGNLGFLTDVEKEHGFIALSKVLGGEYRIERRMLIEADFPTEKPLMPPKRLAVNEVNICGNGKLTEFSVYVSESPLYVFRADGIVVATPTGSTAYSLSAGGPLLMPCAKMMVITPVSPHSFGIRPLVIEKADTVRIGVRGKARVMIDGNERGHLLSGQSAVIYASKYETSIMKTVSSNIYTTLRKKKMIL